ncbi:MAG: hypothetical protein JOZ02_11830 [Acidobacteria bacterium]|nr:hypothetical protein [Acidobacteriota bacterium]
MLNMYKLAEWSRNRALARSVDVKGSEFENTRTYTALKQPFYKRLLDACKFVSDSPKAVPDAIFLALPERLLGKCAYLCLGKTRKSSDDVTADRPDELTDSMIQCLREHDEEGLKAQFINLETPEQLQHVKHVLICHGLSPIEDSILLLADLGRAYRTSWALGYDMEVMLADISWMSSNRSIRQFPTLTNRDIDTGLRVCLDKRTRLYEAVGIQPKRHEIVPYDKAKKISGKKLEQISSRYLGLAKLLWGDNTVGRLEHEKVKRISQLLDRIPLRAGEDIPPHIHTLGQFPGVLAAIEEKLKPHLEILRVIAKQFNSFDEEVFTYFFAQYYAQDAYRGAVLKVAPESEKTFDEPFDKLDPYFRAWGEGHSTTDILSGTYSPAKPLKPLSVTYQPQYSIGGFSVLPYTPLSLDALRLEDKNHNVVQQRLIILEDIDADSIDGHIGKNSQLLSNSSIVKRNQVVADVLGFIMLCLQQGYGKEIEGHCGTMGFASFDDLLGRFSKKAPSYLARERVAQKPEDIQSLWQTWLENIQIDPNPDYIPLHLFFYMLDDTDWSEGVYRAGGAMLVLAQLIYKMLT